MYYINVIQISIIFDDKSIEKNVNLPYLEIIYLIFDDKYIKSKYHDQNEDLNLSFYFKHEKPNL